MSSHNNHIKMETGEGIDSGYITARNSRESTFGSLNGHTHTNGRNHVNGHQTFNDVNGVPEIRNENDAGGMTVTATIGTSSPRTRRRFGSRPDSGVGVSVTQQVIPGHGRSPVDTTAATLLRPAAGNEGNSRIQANYSVYSDAHHSTSGNVLGHVSIGQVKEEVDQKPQPQQKEPVKPACNGHPRVNEGHHQHGHHNDHDHHHHHHHHRPEPPKPEPETMDIRVQFFNNNRIKTFTVLVTATVDDLLKAIKEEKCVDMPIDQMRLVYAGKNLERGVKLSRYDIKGTVLLTGRLRGG